jgi:hypothetical protein
MFCPITLQLILQYLTNEEYLINSRYVTSKSALMIPKISRMFGVSLKTRMLDKILYEVGNSDICLYLHSFMFIFANRYNNIILPLMWQYFVIPNRINKRVNLRT